MQPPLLQLIAFVKELVLYSANANMQKMAAGLMARLCVHPAVRSQMCTTTLIQHLLVMARAEEPHAALGMMPSPVQCSYSLEKKSDGWCVCWVRAPNEGPLTTFQIVG
jgi:hypothetical protein